MEALIGVVFGAMVLWWMATATSSGGGGGSSGRSSSTDEGDGSDIDDVDTELESIRQLQRE
jgi:hypothetical protein